MKTLNVKILLLLLAVCLSQVGWGQTNPTAQTLPYTQGFGSSTFTTMPTGMAAWTAGGNRTTQSAAESALPAADATVNSATAAQTTGAVYGYAAASNARAYIQQSSNATNGTSTIAVAVNTGAFTGFVVSYQLELIQGGVTTQDYGHSLQYRQGTSGAFTNISGSAITFGAVTSYTPTTLTYTVSGLSASSVYQIRWVTWRPTGTGASKGIGIDNINVSGFVSSCTPPSVPTASATQTFASCSAPTVASLTAVGTSLKWYLNNTTLGGALSAGTALVDATNYYATQTVGCESGLSAAVLVSYSGCSLATITTSSASNIATTSATIGADVVSSASSVTDKGTLWGTSPSPLTNSVSQGTGIGAFTTNISGLTANTLYYFRGYAVNGAGTQYSTDGTLTTIHNAPTSPVGASNTYSTFTASWAAPASGGSATFTYEVQVDDDNLFGSVNASVAGISSSVLTTNFSSGISGGTTYYVRVRANNAGGSSAWSANSTGVTTPAAPLFYESFGTGGPTANSTVCTTPVIGQNDGSITSMPLNSGWKTNATGGTSAGNDPCGNWGINGSSASSATYTSPYSGSASGGNNLTAINYGLITNTFVVTSPGISTLGKSNIGVTWNARRTGTGATTTFEYSVNNGGTWTAISFADVAGNSTWVPVNGGNWIKLCSDADNKSAVYLRWTYVQSGGTSGNNGNYRMDDIRVQNAVGAITAPVSSSILGFNNTSGVIPPQAGYAFGLRLQTFDVTNASSSVSAATVFQISKLSGSGTLGGTLTASMSACNNLVDFSGITYSSVESGSGASFLVTPISGNTSIAPATITGVKFVGLTENIVPQNMMGVTTPALYTPLRLTLNGLTPNTTYRYIPSILNTASDITGKPFSTFNGSTNGNGNAIFVGSPFVRASSPSLSTSYGSLTTDASGNFSGWFIIESNSSSRLSAGADVAFRILLNDGASGTAIAHSFTTTNTARARAFGSSNNSSSCSAIYGNSLATAKNFVFLYDNLSGTGRPVSGAFVESAGFTRGTEESFYATNVSAVSSAWGTVIPNDNSNGIQRIANYDFSTGALVDFNTATGGNWTSSGSVTANPSNGNSTFIALDNVEAPLVNLPTLAIIGSTSQFAGAPGSSSSAQTLTITGRNLTATGVNVSLGTSNFEVSNNGTTYGTSANFTAASTFTKVLYVRFKPASVGTYNDIITVSNSGATSVTASVSGVTTSTYSWNQTSGGSWATASNWTPARNSPSTADILSIDGVNGTITNVPSQTIESLSITNSNVIFNASGTNTLTIGQTAGTDFVVGASSNLTLGGATNKLTIALASGNKGSVYGTITTTGAAHVLTASSSADPITFYSGAVAGQGGGTMFSGTSVIVFTAGSSMIINSGANPFTSATFDPASSMIYTANSGFSTSGRVFPNLVVKSGVSLSSTAPNSIASLIVEPTGSLTFTGSPSTTLTGVTTIAGTFTWSSSGALVNNGTFHTNNSANATYAIGNLTNNGIFNVYANVLNISGTLVNTGTINIADKGTLLQTITSANSGGTYNISRSATNINDWSFYASPVNNGSIINLGNGPSWYFNESAVTSYTNGWTSPASTMTNGLGYLAFPSNLVFSGVANNGTIPVTVSYTSTGDLTADITAAGWNLVGNPYPSSINKSGFTSLASNSGKIVGNAVYVWKSNGVGSADNYTAVGPANIPSGQAFFVKVTSGTTQLTFDNTLRGALNASTPFYRTEDVVAPKVNLRLDNGKDWQEIQVGLDPTATDGYDSALDASVFNGNPSISFYSETDGRKLAIQALASPVDGSKVVPLYYSSTKGGTYKITQFGYENPDPSVTVYLKDKTTGQETDLSTTTVVSTTLVKGSDVNRFDLVFRQSAVTGSTDNVVNGSLNVYTSTEMLNVSFTNPSSSTADVYVFNTLGTEILKSNNVSTVGTKSFATSNLNKGVYIVKVGFANGKVENRKIVIE